MQKKCLNAVQGVGKMVSVKFGTEVTCDTIYLR